MVNKDELVPEMRAFNVGDIYLQLTDKTLPGSPDDHVMLVVGCYEGKFPIIAHMQISPALKLGTIRLKPLLASKSVLTRIDYGWDQVFKQQLVSLVLAAVASRQYVISKKAIQQRHREFADIVSGLTQSQVTTYLQQGDVSRSAEKHVTCYQWVIMMLQRTCWSLSRRVPDALKLPSQYASALMLWHLATKYRCSMESGRLFFARPRLGRSPLAGGGARLSIHQSCLAELRAKQKAVAIVKVPARIPRLGLRLLDNKPLVSMKEQAPRMPRPVTMRREAS